jgi:hypothetical protein
LNGFHLQGQSLNLSGHLIEAHEAVNLDIRTLILLFGQQESWLVFITSEVEIYKSPG